MHFRVLTLPSNNMGTIDGNSSPQYTWSDHALPVTDLHCGCGGIRAHVVTSSLDQTCKVLAFVKKSDQSFISAEIISSCTWMEECGCVGVRDHMDLM